MGPSPAGFRALPEGCGHLFGRVCPHELLNYWAPVKKKQARLRTRTGLLTSGNFSYYVGPIADWVLGVTGGVWAFIRAGLSQWLGFPKKDFYFLDRRGISRIGFLFSSQYLFLYQIAVSRVIAGWIPTQSMRSRRTIYRSDVIHSCFLARARFEYDHRYFASIYISECSQSFLRDGYANATAFYVHGVRPPPPT